MTATPEHPGTAAGYAIPEDAADEQVDVLYLAGQRPPAGGTWLRVTAAGARRGGEFTALFLPEARPSAAGGDVLVHITPGATPATEPGPTVRVRVAAVVAGSVIHVAEWDRLGLEDWPETARPAVTFAIGALRELEAHGADVGARRHSPGPVPVDSAAETAVTGFPALPAAGSNRQLSPGHGRAPRGARPCGRGRPQAAWRNGPGGRRLADLTLAGEPGVHPRRRRSPRPGTRTAAVPSGLGPWRQPAGTA